MFIASFRIQPFERWFSNEDDIAGFWSGTFQAQVQAPGTILKVSFSIAPFLAKTLNVDFSKTVRPVENCSYEIVGNDLIFVANNLHEIRSCTIKTPPVEVAEDSSSELLKDDFGRISSRNKLHFQLQQPR